MKIAGAILLLIVVLAFAAMHILLKNDETL